MKTVEKIKYVVQYNNDSEGSTIWQVWGFNGVRLTYRFAEFYGRGAQTFAREHARRLNLLPKESEP
jgi:hypothetical protein